MMKGTKIRGSTNIIVRWLESALKAITAPAAICVPT